MKFPQRRRARLTDPQLTAKIVNRLRAEPVHDRRARKHRGLHRLGACRGSAASGRAPRRTRPPRPGSSRRGGARDRRRRARRAAPACAAPTRVRAASARRSRPSDRRRNRPSPRPAIRRRTSRCGWRASTAATCPIRDALRVRQTSSARDARARRDARRDSARSRSRWPPASRRSTLVVRQSVDRRHDVVVEPRRIERRRRAVEQVVEQRRRLARVRRESARSESARRARSPGRTRPRRAEALPLAREPRRDSRRRRAARRAICASTIRPAAAPRSAHALLEIAHAPRRSAASAASASDVERRACTKCPRRSSSERCGSPQATVSAVVGRVRSQPARETRGTRRAPASAASAKRVTVASAAPDSGSHAAGCWSNRISAASHSPQRPCPPLRRTRLERATRRRPETQGSRQPRCRRLEPTVDRRKRPRDERHDAEDRFAGPERRIAAIEMRAARVPRSGSRDTRRRAPDRPRPESGGPRHRRRRPARARARRAARASRSPRRAAPQATSPAARSSCSCTPVNVAVHRPARVVMREESIERRVRASCRAAARPSAARGTTARRR